MPFHWLQKWKNKPCCIDWPVLFYFGTYVTFTNTIQAFYRLLNQEVDILFGARPSIEQYEMAKEMNMDLNVVPIGKEAFVFFVQEDNPIDNLTSDQIRSIYHGTITNWKEVGGKDEETQAFQRPKNSGSQTMMEYFMKDVSLKEAKTYETIAAMEGVISKVAQYNDEKGAMGYSFRYFIEVLQQEKNVKILSVDGIYPSIENIRNGSYPLIVDVCAIYNRSNSNENVSRLMNFILSKEGQAIVEQTGYSPIGG
ncbi:MAG: substrate-binding domain-containing protein [Floccifex porci]|nr:substrate-binding domain-containing protein [Floccifex porci]